MKTLGVWGVVFLALAAGCGDEKADSGAAGAGQAAPAAGDKSAPAASAQKVSETPAPPSTGNEMEKPAEVRLTPAQAKEALARIDEELKKPGEPTDAACDQMV